MQLGLTREQIEKRRHSLGGSDANKILSGKPESIIRLWREKRGEIEPEDLSGVLPVQMGSFTEAFNRFWFEKTTGRLVTDAGSERIDFERPYMTTTLDGLTDHRATVWEAKHVSAYADKDEVRGRYMPQLHHNMIVTDTHEAVLSVFFGTLEHVVFEVERDPFYELELLEAEARFWECVESGEMPTNLPAPAPPVEAVKTVDFTGNNQWAALAHDWLTHKDHAKAFDDAKSGIKELIEADVIKAFGHGIVVSRNKAGNLAIKGAK